MILEMRVESQSLSKLLARLFAFIHLTSPNLAWPFSGESTQSWINQKAMTTL
jgi:hypothetical protein